MNRHIKKTSRLYEEKRKTFYNLLKKYFKNQAEILMGSSGMEIGLIVNKPYLREKIKKSGVAVHIVEETDEHTTMLLSCGIIDENEMESAVKKLYLGLQK